ncbi:hypothetical protein GGR51DRAFT_263150 [Nemania sp. FL0031]|nr:hypothetical protein GGR51DRAFT_263150 [Nemania sp. FL0031]
MASRKAKDAKAAENDFQFANATPIQIWRSDGTEMPSEYSQYEKVEEGAKPIIEWQNKLGQALAAELMPGANGLYFLQEFPSHYHLRWYQAAKEDKKKHQAKHYYLFGYPEDPGASKARKYYRSPNHFLPHLLWLIGESQDRGDCACEFCSGSKPITSKSAKAKPVSSGGPTPLPTTTNPLPTASTNITNNGTPMQKNIAANSNGRPRPMSRPSLPVQQPVQQPVQLQQPVQQPMQQPVQQPVQQRVRQSVQQPTSREAQPVAPYQAPEAALSTSQRPYPIAHDHDALFRSGEAVWYKNNNSWRVGMILTSSPSLSIIPFGHPLYPTQPVIKEEADIRPFLAFSIPLISPALQEFQGQALVNINWQALQDRFGTNVDATRREGLAIEATKLAATRVDQSYSTFNPIQEAAQHYDAFGGIFLGAEKICVGEAVRIKLPREQQEQLSEPVTVVVKRILVKREGGALVFEGSLWKLHPLPLSQQPRAANQAQLPRTMLREKEFRDNVFRDRGWCVEWELVNQNLTLDELSIRGRFYETGRLTPILNPVKYQDMLQRQQIDDIQTLLNNRGDSKGPPIGRVLNRAQAVAGAVPTNLLSSLGPDVIEAQP